MAADKKDINTGTSGFDVDGRVYTYDTGLEESSGGDQGAVDHGNVKVNNDKKDLTKKTKVTLAKYLSDTTMGKRGSTTVPNKYPVSSDVSTATLSTESGYPAVPTTPIETTFAPKLPDSYTQQFPAVNPNIKKGKSAKPGAVDGNDLLSGATTTTKPLLSRYTSAVLANNRFTDAAQSAALSDIGSPPSDYDPTLRRSTQLGSSVTGEDFAVNRLAQVGPILTMRASLELGSTDAGFSANSGTGEANALLPGTAQLALSRVNQNLLLAKDVLSNLTTDEVSGVEFISPGSLSWGALNNVDDQFSGIAALGMAALSTALVAGLLITIDGLSTVLGLITTPAKHATHDAQGRYALGSYYSNQRKPNNGGLLGAASALVSLDVGSLLGIQPTNFPFSVALKAGSGAFFGITDTGVLGQLAGAASQGLSADAGYNAIVARTIVRSTLTIIDQIKKIGGNPINAVKQVLGLIDVLKTSKIISACNVFAQLGDSILSVPSDFVDGDSVGGIKVSQLDASRDESAVSKNRRPGGLKLAWSSNRAPTNLLVSQQVGAVSRIATSLGSYDTHAGLQDIDSKMQLTLIKQDATPRIDPDDAALFEKQLDAEYVPFYFHDLRTNEMIGFHAFLTSLSDDYTPNYESIDAYGRVEPIKIYKSTARRIGLSFYVAATSLQDFDDMWVKINRLTTLIYPQYTAGKQLQDKDAQNIFTQPFSQLIGASPLIRIRLGDLFRSNYSRFNLARLFGLGNSGFTLDGNQFANFDKFDDDVIKSQLPAKINDAKKTEGKTFIATHGNYKLAPKDSSGVSVSVNVGIGGAGLGSGDAPLNAQQFVPTGVPDFFEVKIVREDPNNSNNVIGEVQVTTDPDSLAILNQSILLDKIKRDYADTSKPLQNYVGGKYIFPKLSLLPSRRTQEDAMNAIISISENDEFVTPLQNFMNPDNNAVVKSFKDTAGKGLAGFIDSMSFDWYDKVTWETGAPDRVAPKMCKVTIGFSPIHDISPGLDHLGVNRAPIYPVGAFAPRTETR